MPSAKLAEHAPQELIRLLLRQSEAGLPACAGSNDAEEVILDVDLDGDRYILIRMPRLTTPRVQLSPREQEIVRMVAMGHSNKIIADVLSISSWTVCTHLRRIFAKLGVSSRAAMVATVAADFEGAIDLKEAVVSALPRRRVSSPPGAGQLHDRP